LSSAPPISITAPPPACGRTERGRRFELGILRV
jgi:hypothetical protein